MSQNLKKLNEKEKELISLNEKLNENKLKLQNDYVKNKYLNNFILH